MVVGINSDVRMTDKQADVCYVDVCGYADDIGLWILKKKHH